ncbi:desmethylxanthohumol 6'-O-methyltransferase-like, partial [Bidens hawaiensis]|uniref:desmethylxanthohumol 6'-O-methyltransferase-like n=1 Tax=Bidens hawaiensis TaxID=980011 RepID=UPI004049F299
MSLVTRKEDDARIRGQAWVYKQLQASFSSAALRCAVQLDIAGIVNSHDGPISLSQIADGINSPSVDVAWINSHVSCDPLMFSPYYNLNQSIEEGGSAALKTYGMEIWDLCSHNPQANKIFNEAMECLARVEIDAILSIYDFGSLKGTLVDVGGGVGATLNEIVTKYPHLK